MLELILWIVVFCVGALAVGMLAGFAAAVGKLLFVIVRGVYRRAMPHG